MVRTTRTPITTIKIRVPKRTQTHQMDSPVKTGLGTAVDAFAQLGIDFAQWKNISGSNAKSSQHCVQLSSSVNNFIFLFYQFFKLKKRIFLPVSKYEMSTKFVFC